MKNKMLDWLLDHPEVKSLRLATPDLNGLPRGKRIPASHAGSVFSDGARMPLSVLNVDIWGEDIRDSPLVFESGDADGTLLPTERGLVPMTWFASPTALLPLWMSTDGGKPFAGDPRHALRRVVARYTALGLTPVVATEMEFYLLDGEETEALPPLSPLSGRRLQRMNVLSISGLDAFDDFFTDLYEACEAMDIPADAAISESGIGQFEINLLHTDDALKAADDAWLFKMAVRGVARKHGLMASFMAKPYGSQPGNGLHSHFSLLDRDGNNVFDDGTAKGSKMLHHAVGGLLAAMRPSTLIFAPHFNSYQRHSEHSHAPTSIGWGYENRTAAIRIPGGNPKARRIEHRVSGGDANPYLMLAVILGGALRGIENRTAPPAPVKGDAYGADAPSLPEDWDEAIELFNTSEVIQQIFPADLIANFVMCKQQEAARFRDAPEGLEFITYVESV